MALKKAKIIITEGSNKGDELEVMFNPNEYRISRKVNYSTIDIQSVDTKLISYKNGDPATLTLQLFFNCDMYYTASGKKEKEENVRVYTERLFRLTKKGKKEIHPPACKFIWGKFTFEGYVTSTDEKFTRFSESGVPTRAVVDLTILEKPNANDLDDVKSLGKISTNRRDELYNIAESPEQWRKIAKDKNILNPRVKS